MLTHSLKNKKVRYLFSCIAVVISALLQAYVIQVFITPSNLLSSGFTRMSLCEKSLHIPVIAIGVATVTSIGAILHETLEVSGEEKQHILQKIQDSNYLNLVVTPKSMDDELKHLVYIVSESLNRFLHPNYEQL